MRSTLFTLALAAALAAGPAVAQQPATPAVATSEVEGPQSLDALLDALYAVVSGEAGPRDWDRFRSLFYPGATLTPSGRRADGSLSARVLTPDGYIAQNGPLFEREGFFEKEIGRSVRQFGPMVQVSSAFEARHAPTDAQPFLRGVNAIQAYDDGKRWWVISIAWSAESPEWPVPADLLTPVTASAR